METLLHTNEKLELLCWTQRRSYFAKRTSMTPERWNNVSAINIPIMEWDEVTFHLHFFNILQLSRFLTLISLGFKDNGFLAKIVKMMEFCWISTVFLLWIVSQRLGKKWDKINSPHTFYQTPVREVSLFELAPLVLASRSSLKSSFNIQLCIIFCAKLSHKCHKNAPCISRWQKGRSWNHFTTLQINYQYFHQPWIKTENYW